MYPCTNQCGTKAHVVETRRQQNGDVRRRYQCPKCGNRFSTIELIPRPKVKANVLADSMVDLDHASTPNA